MHFDNISQTVKELMHILAQVLHSINKTRHLHPATLQQKKNENHKGDVVMVNTDLTNAVVEHLEDAPTVISKLAKLQLRTPNQVAKITSAGIHAF